MQCSFLLLCLEHHFIHNDMYYRQKQVSRRCMNKSRAQFNRRIEQLEKDLENERRRANRYKKRHQRALKKSAQPKLLTPRSKTRRLLRFMSVSTNVRKTLLFHNVIVHNLRRKYASLKSRGARKNLQNLFATRTIRKYKMLTLCRDVIGFSANSGRCSKLKTTRSYSAFCSKLKMDINQFYVRDDVSRATAGKKETITRKKNKIKMQKKFVTDTLENLHRKFRSENPLVTVSYSLFCRLRPFWVLLPDLKSRDTCLCKLHENLSFMAQKLHQMHLIDTTNLELLVTKCCCSTASKHCMYGLCEMCKNMHIPLIADVDLKEPIAYKQWMVSTEEKKKKSGTVWVKMTKKENVLEPLEKFIVKFNEMMIKFKKHFFNINHQFLQYRYLKGSLGENECMIHIDFSENFTCKYFKEIQSVHFGSSHSQATLHNGLFYIRTGNEVKPVSFCTISDSKQHDPNGIWTYLDPVLKLIKEQYPRVNIIHFFSDGPATQYRQKLNFYYFCTKIQLYGFSAGTWNFSEAGHGKGAADGVGGALKRTADKMASLQYDISTPKLLFDVLSPTKSNILLFYVSADVVSATTASAPLTVPVVPGTMNIHQVLCMRYGQIQYRDVSCFCSADKISCTCYEVKDFSFSETCTVTTNDEIPSSDLTANKKNSKHSDPDVWTPITDLTSELVGKFCIIRYDGKPFPGKILRVEPDDDDALIECMSRIGDNRFFWPVFRDEAWYMCDDILGVIPAPILIGRSGRHHQVHPVAWEYVCKLLQ